jgi:EAL domain-containing protein (putative c-di-GMP-specific phosphodiesterase class I)
MHDYNGFYLLYQPVVDAQTEKLVAAEALLRWRNDEYGIVPPDHFIPVLERDPLFPDLGEWILRTSIIAAKKIRELYPDFIINVNLSYSQIEKPEFVEMVMHILRNENYPPENLCLEITERCRLLDMDLLKNVVVNLRGSGVKIALDDFGTGFSSVGLVKNLAFDVIKIDRSFVLKIEQDEKERKLIEHFVKLGSIFGANICVEGIETAQMRDILKQYGVSGFQGYYYSKPISREKLTELADQNPKILESREDAIYWNAIGRLNFVNPNPLKDFSERRRAGMEKEAYVGSYDGSIALVECGRDHFEYVYATDGYKDRLRDLGFATVGGLENALSSQRSHQFLIFQKLVLDALKTGLVQTVEYAYKDVYFRLSALAVARREGRAMIVMRLNTFDSEREVQTAQELLNSSSALLTTYDLVVLFYPERKAAKRIYTANKLAEYDREESFEISLRKFCEEQVDPVDQERYLRFMNISTMEERIGKSPGHFVQSLFRMRLVKARALGPSPWTQTESAFTGMSFPVMAVTLRSFTMRTTLEMATSSSSIMATGFFRFIREPSSS